MYRAALFETREMAGGCLKRTSVEVRVSQLSLLVFIIFLSSSILVSFFRT